METRARRAAAERVEALPSEVWQLIVSFLTPPEAVRVSAVCLDFAAISTAGAQGACRRLWPQHAKRLPACGPSGVQRFLRLVQAHEEETAAHPDIAKAKSVQKTVCPEHRQIAVEWLIEVSWDWQLESTVVYRGTQYLDHYLASHAVPALSKFQMLAISCLRTALKHSSKLAEREHQRLPFKHWAEVTDGACTEAEVRSTCSKLERMLHQQQRSHPNAKQRLRYLWYRLYDGGAVKQEHVFIYMLASFLLHLSLLDSTLSAVTPTKLALAALSLALKVFGLPPMPPVLAEHCFYLEEELQEVQQQLALAQEQVVGQQLRALWVQSYSYVGSHPSQQPAYALLQQLVAAPGKISYLPVSSSSSTSGERKADAAAAAAPAATAAAAAQGVTEAAAAGAGSAGTVHRVMTRAAAAAGLAHSNRHQQVPPAAAPAATAAAAAAAVPSAERISRNAAGSSHASSSRTAAAAAAAAPPAAQPSCIDNDQGAALATPQRPAAVGGAPMAPTMGPLHPFAVVFEPSAAATPPATLAAAAAPTAAVHHSEPATGGHQQQPPSTGPGSTTRRCPTRELPPRRAVAVSRYGMLASRSSTHGTPGGLGSAAPHGDGPSSSGSRAAAAAQGTAGAGPSAQQRYGSSSWHAGSSRAGPTAGAAPAAVAGAAAGASGSGEATGSQPTAAGGPLSLRTRPAGAAGAPAGSMTPASPKHATAGTRGLAALFAGVGPGGASSSHAGASGSNTGRLLSGLPSLQAKPSTRDSEGLLQDRLSNEDPSWMWCVHQAEPGSHGCDGSKAGPSSSGGSEGLHQHSSVPVLRSMRRSVAAGGGGAGSHGHHDSNEVLHKLHERAGVHTRSSSGGGSADAGSSHWHAVTSGGSRLSHHAYHE